MTITAIKPSTNTMSLPSMATSATHDEFFITHAMTDSIVDDTTMDNQANFSQYRDQKEVLSDCESTSETQC